VKYSGDIGLKAVVFDWDLTLWNSWDIHMDLMSRTADALGHPRPAILDLGREYSRPFSKHLEWFFPGDQKKIVDTYLGFYYSSVWQEHRLYPGIKDLLQRLKDDGYRTAILSDKQHVYGMPEFEHSGFGATVDCAQFFADGMAPKPDPRGLEDVMRSLGVSPGECLYVGDSERDIACAQRAGAWSGAALWASVERDNVLALNPEFRWEQINDVGTTLNLGGAR